MSRFLRPANGNPCPGIVRMGLERRGEAIDYSFPITHIGRELMN